MTHQASLQFPEAAQGECEVGEGTVDCTSAGTASAVTSAQVSSLAIDVSAAHSSDHLKSCLVQQKEGLNITHNAIWASQKTLSFVFRLLAVFNVSCFLAFVEASNIISSILSIY